MMRHAVVRALGPLFLGLLGSALVPMTGCGDGTKEGQTIQSSPEIEKKNQDRGEQIRKEMEAKFKKKSGRP